MISGSGRTRDYVVARKNRIWSFYFDRSFCRLCSATVLQLCQSLFNAIQLFLNLRQGLGICTGRGEVSIRVTGKDKVSEQRRSGK